ncbi:hypothetical protein [Pseudomonas saponiphila]|uniref:hypothetical protein n=1 Tax=Pseudomonas saponiphila TaxID=556534 RepID=UPI00224098ED|nr:hypothetical protein [Pseudomonas saponiphila]
MKIRLLVFISVLSVSGCGSNNYQQSPQEQPYDPATTARIRLFGNNGLPAAIKPGQDCMSKQEPVYAYGYSLADKVNSTLGQHTRRSVGMPASWRSEHLSYGESYAEFVIPAGKPSVVLMKMVAGQAFCLPPANVFEPQPGKDYEAYLHRQSGTCMGVIRQLSTLENPGPAADVSSDSCAKQ